MEFQIHHSFLQQIHAEHWRHRVRLTLSLYLPLMDLTVQCGKQTKITLIYDYKPCYKRKVQTAEKENISMETNLDLRKGEYQK